MDNAIREVIDKTSCPCTPQCVNDDGYRIGIALVRNIEIDNDVHLLNGDASGFVLLCMSINAVAV